MKIKAITIFITCPSKKEAHKIKDVLLASRIVACVSIIKSIDSFYWWKGRIESSKEFLLIAKSTSRLFSQVIKTVKKYHSYEVPEIVAMPITGGNPDYLKWIGASIK